MQNLDVRTILRLNQELLKRFPKSSKESIELERTKLAKLFAFYTKNLHVPRLNFHSYMTSNGKYIHSVVENALMDLRHEASDRQWLEQFQNLREWVTQCTQGQPCLDFPLERDNIRENNGFIQNQVALNPTPMFIEGTPEEPLQTPAANYGNTGQDVDDIEDEEDMEEEIEMDEPSEEPAEINENVEEPSEEPDETIEEPLDELVEPSEEPSEETDENIDNNVNNVEETTGSDEENTSTRLKGDDLRNLVFQKLDDYPMGIHYTEMAKLVNYHDPNRIRIILSGVDKKDTSSEARVALGNGQFIARKYITKDSIPGIIEHQKKYHGNLSKLTELLHSSIASTGTETNTENQSTFHRQSFVYNLNLDNQDTSRIRELGTTDKVRDGMMKQIANVKSAIQMIAKEQKVTLPEYPTIEKTAIDSFKIHEENGKKIGRISIRKVWQSLLENNDIKGFLQSLHLETTPEMIKIAEKISQDTNGDQEKMKSILTNMNTDLNQ